MKARLSPNQILALVALLLGVGAVAMGDPYAGSTVQLNTRELAAIVEGEVDHVTAIELADWIVQGNTEYRLIDLREAEEYAEYHIPSAENVAITELDDYPLLRNEKIVLYSGGGIHSAQAWFLLKAERYTGAYMLLGGLDAWMDEVLFPALPAEATPQQIAEFEKLRVVSEYFGGRPRTGGEAQVEQAAVPLPQVDASAQPVIPTRKKRKKEGC
jgi:rhodanese-related sulfurtransferase